MPTPQPPAVAEPRDQAELEARYWGQNFMNLLLQKLHGYTYGTRSHVPGDNDCTDFFDALNKVQRWVNERPDWALDILTDVMGRHPRNIPADMQGMINDHKSQVRTLEYQLEKFKKAYEDNYERDSHIRQIKFLEDKVAKLKEGAKTVVDAAKKMSGVY